VSLLGIDVGTSAIKIVAFERDTGATLASARASYPSDHPAPGRMELDPDDVWAGFVDAVRFVGASDAVHLDPVTALALSVSCDEVIPVDDAGRPLGPCIMAPDTRGADVIAEIHDRISMADLYRRTGLPLLPLYPLARILWYRKHQPATARAAARYLGWGEFILARLGLPAVADETTAGRWLAYDVVAGEWMLDLLGRLSVPPTVLPAVAAPGEVIGALSDAASTMLGLRGNPVVVAGAFDQICAAVGAGLRAPGDVVVGTGTWENTTILAERPLGDFGLEQGATWGRYVSPGLYAVLVMNASGGSVVRWFGEQFADPEGHSAMPDGHDPYDRLPGMAQEQPTRLLFLPHLQGSHAPWRDPDSKGALVGLTLATTREEVFRALLEGITYELRLNLEGLAPEVPIRPPIRNTGGGARSKAWVQLKADVLGMPFCSVEARESGCLGAAILAGIGSGAYPSVVAAQERVCRTTAQVDPDPDRHRFYDDQFALYRELYPTLRSTLGAI
jgi:xylulokinase